MAMAVGQSILNHIQKLLDKLRQTFVQMLMVHRKWILLATYFTSSATKRLTYLVWCFNDYLMDRYDVHVAQRMNPVDFGDPFTSNVTPPVSICEQLLDRLAQNLAQTFMVPRRWISLTSVISWLSIYHHETDKCGLKWNDYWTIRLTLSSCSDWNLRNWTSAKCFFHSPLMKERNHCLELVYLAILAHTDQNLYSIFGYVVLELNTHKM